MWSLRYIVLYTYTVHVESSNLFVITAMLSSAHHRTHDKDIRTHWTKKLHTGDFLPVAPWDYASVASIHRLRRNGGPMNANSSTRNVVEWFSRFLGLWLRRTTKASSGGAEMMCTSWCLRVVNLDVNFSWGLVKVSDVKLLRTVKDRIENCQGQDHVQLYITSQYVTQEVKCE